MDELRRSHHFLNNVIDNIRDSIIVVDLDYHILLANKAVKEIWGEGDQAQRYICCYELLHHHSKPCDQVYAAHPCPLNDVISKKRPSIVKQFFLNQENKVLFKEVVASPILDERGDIVQIVISLHHIVPPKWEEEEIEGLIHSLREALSKAKRLNGVLTICVSCKRICNHKGGWKKLGVYIEEHLKADFTHGLCPLCKEGSEQDIDKGN